MRSVIPTWLAPGIAISDSPLRSPMSVKSKPKPLPNKLDLSKIPTFVPRTASESDELVWSPTSGTRKRRPDEVYQQSTKGPPANSMRFGQYISPNVDSLHSIKAQYPFHGSRGLSDDSTKSHRRLDSLAMTPSPGFKSFQSPFNPPAALPSRSNEKPNPGHKRRNNPQRSSLFSSSIDGINYLNEIFSPPSHVDTKAYSVNDLSLTNSPSQLRGPRHPPSQVRGVYGADPFSAPPSVTGYGNQNQPSQSVHRGPPTPVQGQLGPFQSGPDAKSFHSFSGQEPSHGMYHGSPSPYQGQLGSIQSGPDVASFHPFTGQEPSQGTYRGSPNPFQGQLDALPSGRDIASFRPSTGQEPSQGMYRGPPSTVQDQLGPLQSGPDVASYSPFAGQLPYRPNPEIRATQSSRPRHGAMPSQMSNQSSQSCPHMMAQTQMPPSMAHAPDNEILSVPTPGSMDPLVHWNLLHQREFEIRTRLQNANRQMTEQEHRYIFQLRKARVNAVATQMPARSGMSQGKWLAELGRTLRGIWKTGPGGTGFTPLVVARKMDFEQAVEREIERISQQRKQRGNWSALGRTQGTVPTSTMTYRREMLDQQRRNLQNSTSGRG